MKVGLAPQQVNDQAAFRAFVAEQVIPHADRYDREEQIPAELVGKLAQEGYLGALIPQEEGGRGLDLITYGLLTEEIGRGCSSVRSLLTVHDMVAQALTRWGKQDQRKYWLPQLASGEIIAAFALSESNVGSDAKSIETVATLSGDTYVLNGQKKWITFGQIAGLYLVFAQHEGKPCAFLVERNTPGLWVEPIFGMLGTRASMLAELHFENCRVPKENLLGRVGFGVSHVALYALDLGRYSVAWGCVGIGQACLDACLKYTSQRKQFGVYLKDHQLIQRMITEMVTQVRAARLLCFQAGYAKQSADPSVFMETAIAKYFASRMATKVSCDAVQVHGANGCSGEYPLQRYIRDARIMEVIEGSTEIQQVAIANYAYQEYVPG
jgi:alkylation response protein AidB-like acyl-CoA dehydrogenase